MKKIKDIIDKKDGNSVQSDSVFRDVIERMNKDHLGAVAIIKNKKIVGIVTDGDLRRLILNTQKTLAEVFMIKTKKIMEKNPEKIRERESLEKALKIMIEKKYTVLPVISNKEEYIGMVHIHKILNEIYGEATNDIS